MKCKFNDSFCPCQDGDPCHYESYNGDKPIVLNVVIRKCNRCANRGDEDENFSYMGNGVWACSICGCKYTTIVEVIEPLSS